MAKLTQKEEYMISIRKNESFHKYLMFCKKHNEVPREEIYELINGCNSIEALNKSIIIFNDKLKSTA